VVAWLRTIERDLTKNGGTIDAKELAPVLADVSALQGTERAEADLFLRRFYYRNVSQTLRFDPEARGLIEKHIGLKNTFDPATDVMSSVHGDGYRDLAGGTVFFGKDGALKLSTGIQSYTRAWAQTNRGVLRTSHGSTPPKSDVPNPTENRINQMQKPGQALDRVASLFGVESGESFEKLAERTPYYRPLAENWEGFCHSWVFTSLNQWLNERVDVPGDKGQTGLWIGGQWMSRGDLGNWLMALGNLAMIDIFKTLHPQVNGPGGVGPTPEQLIAGVINNLGSSGIGFYGDRHDNEKEKRDVNGNIVNQIWNQPWIGADVTTKTLDAKLTAEVIALAKADAAKAGTGPALAGATQVKLVKMTAKMGNEVNDRHEDAPKHDPWPWNAYVVLDAKGKMLKAYMADDLAKALPKAALPEKTSKPIPDYFGQPVDPILDNAIAGIPDGILAKEAKPFYAFVQTILKNGVSGKERTTFEAAVKAATVNGKVPPAKAAELAKAHPNLANAYTPDQWARAFGKLGLDAKAFGAAWKGELPDAKVEAAFVSVETGGIEASELVAIEKALVATYGAEMANELITHAIGARLGKLTLDGVAWLRKQHGQMNGNLARYDEAVQEHVPGGQVIDHNFNGMLDNGDQAVVAGPDGKLTLHSLGKHIEGARDDKTKISDAILVEAHTVKAAEAFAAKKIGFGLPSELTMASNYWRLDDKAKGRVYGLQPGISPAVAVADILARPHLYKLDSSTAAKVVRMMAIIEIVGPGRFNDLVKGLQLGVKDGKELPMPKDFNTIVRVDGGSSLPSTGESRGLLRAGDLAYFRNWDAAPDAGKYDATGTRAIYLGRREGKEMFWAHPLGVVSADAIVAYLNQHRKAGSTRSADLSTSQAWLLPSLVTLR
jgi:protein-glutamine gamma-glutamyltransferase